MMPTLNPRDLSFMFNMRVRVHEVSMLQMKFAEIHVLESLRALEMKCNLHDFYAISYFTD